MPAPKWLRALLERRRSKHEDPWPAEQMDVFRCRVQRLIRSAKS